MAAFGFALPPRKLQLELLFRLLVPRQLCRDLAPPRHLFRRELLLIRTGTGTGTCAGTVGTGEETSEEDQYAAKEHCLHRVGHSATV